MNMGSYWLDDEEGEWAGRRASEQLGGGTGSSEGTSGREPGWSAGRLRRACRRQARRARPAPSAGLREGSRGHPDPVPGKQGPAGPA